MSLIYYNNFPILSGHPTPFIGVDLAPLFRGDGRRIGTNRNFTLDGQITGCNFNAILSGVNLLNGVFSKDFGTLRIDDQNGFLANFSGVKVNEVTYPTSTMVGIQDYQVKLTCYPENFFESNGIIEKKNEWRISQEDDGNLTISHDISAKGTNTAPSFDNAFLNAKNFVLQYTGFTPPSLFPYFITGISGILDNRRESINRIDGTYGITESYIGRTGDSISSNLSVSLESGTDGIITVSLDGQFKIGKASGDFSALRQKYLAFDAFSIASGVYFNYKGATGLVSSPIGSGIIENYGENAISFTREYNDWPFTNYKHVYEVQNTSGVNGIITTIINGNIQGLGRQVARYNNAYAFYTGLNIFSLANNDYLNYVGSSYPYPLVQYPISSGVVHDRFGGLIQYNLAFDNRSFPVTGVGLKNFMVVLDKKHAMRVVAPVVIPNSTQGLDSLDLLYNTRASITVNGTVFVDKPLTVIDATGFISQYINNDFMSGVLGINAKTKIRLDSASITKSIDKETAQFSIVYSFNQAAPINTAQSYTLINSLVL